MEFSLNFDMGNAAFDRDSRENELHRILSKIAKDAGNGHQDGVIADVNGNKIGQWQIEGERADDLEPVAYWITDPGGHYIERYPDKGSRHDGNPDLLDSFREDAIRHCNDYNEERDEERQKWMDGEIDGDEPEGHYVMAVELRNGDTTCEHGTLPA